MMARKYLCRLLPLLYDYFTQNQSLEAHRQMTSNEDVDECEENNFDGPLRLSEVQGCTPSQTEEFVVGHDIGVRLVTCKT